MKLTKLAIILIGFLTFFSACSFEDEIELDPGKFIVYNNSNSSFDLVIENMDLNVSISFLVTLDPSALLE